MAAGVALAATSVADRGPGSAGAQGERAVFSATTGHHGELVKTIPITPGVGAKPRVVMSLTPRQLPVIQPGDTLKPTGEVQISNTCVERIPRCRGRPYHYSPLVDARLVIADGEHVTGGNGATGLAGRPSVRCGQHRPNRNHHCVLVFRRGHLRIDDPGHLPCDPASCFINLVLSAHHAGARPGNLIVVGADRPGGSIGQGKGRLSALVARKGASEPRTRRSRGPVAHALPLAARGLRATRSVYSVKLPPVHRGDVVFATAAQRTAIGHLPYNVFVDDRIVLTTHRRAIRTNKFIRRIAQNDGQITEGNGFNCTQGPSQYRTPCLTRKAGMVMIRREPIRHGHPVRLRVNLVSHGLRKLAHAGRNDHALIRPGGQLKVATHRAAFPTP
jgi:hypothetical protein